MHARRRWSGSTLQYQMPEKAANLLRMPSPSALGREHRVFNVQWRCWSWSILSVFINETGFVIIPHLYHRFKFNSLLFRRSLCYVLRGQHGSLQHAKRSGERRLCLQERILWTAVWRLHCCRSRPLKNTLGHVLCIAHCRAAFGYILN